MESYSGKFEPESTMLLSRFEEAEADERDSAGQQDIVEYTFH